MTEVNVSEREGRLIGVSRAIDRFDANALISIEDVGDALTSLESVTDIKKLETDFSAKEIKIYLDGFVAGLGASRVPQLMQERAESAMYETGQYTAPPDAAQQPTQFVGGPTGGVAVGQGEDPKYVTQSGVHETVDPVK